MNAVIEAMAQRRSCKKYLPKPVPMELLEEIAQAGTYAPNGMGRQSGKIVILTDPEEIAAIEAVNAGILGNPAGHPFYGAPAVLIVLANQAIPTWVEDGSLVMGNLLLAAHSLGLGACWIHRARETFALPEGKALLEKWGVGGCYAGVGHCVVGYPDGNPREAAPRKSDFVVKP